MAGYSKLFSEILTSTIWQEDHTTRIVWITMLAMSDKNGDVFAAVPGLAHAAKVSIEDCEKALETFQNPDPYSRTKEHEGRRIEEIEGGWRLLNHAKYRARMSAEDRREKDRERKAREREKTKQEKAESPHLSALVRTCPETSAMSRHTDTEAEPKAEAEAYTKSKKEESSSSLSSVPIDKPNTPKADEKGGGETSFNYSEETFLRLAEKLEIPKAFASALWVDIENNAGRASDGSEIKSPALFLNSVWKRSQAYEARKNGNLERDGWKIDADIKRAKKEIENLQKNPGSRNASLGFTATFEEHRERFEAQWLETVKKCYDEATVELPEKIAELDVILEAERKAIAGKPAMLQEFDTPEYRLTRFAQEFDVAPDFQKWDKDFNRGNTWRDPKGLTPVALTELRALKQSIAKMEAERREAVKAV